MKTAIRSRTNILCALLLAVAMLGSLGTTMAAAADDFCIPPHEGLPHLYLPPNIDGYVGRIFGVADLSTDPLEQGWTRSGVVSYGYGGTNPWMEFRGIKHNSADFIYLSFVVQYDQAFDANDAIVIVMDPGWTSASTTFSNNARRVEIYPVEGGAGAQGAPGTGQYLIRDNRVPRNVEWKKFQNGSWTGMSAAPSGYEVKVRSWEVATNDKGWSVEIKLPSTSSAGGPNWPNLGSSFGLYSNVVKLCGTMNCQMDPVVLRGFYSNQFTWPRTSYDSTSSEYRVITGNFATLSSAFNTIQPSWLGRAVVGSATANCRGVRFADGPDGIGVLGSGNSLGTSIDATATNTMVARLQNDGNASAGKGIRAEYRIANWGVGGGEGTWDTIPARPPAPGKIPSGPLNANTDNSNRTAPIDVPAGGPHDIWMQTQVLPADNYCNPNSRPLNNPCPPGSRHAHSCIWVLLDSNQGATLSEASVRRNFDIINLSTRQRSAEISAKGWGKPAGPLGTQQFLLTESRRLLVHPGNSEHLKEVETASKGYGVPVSFLLPPDKETRPAELMSPIEKELLRTVGLGKAPLWNYISEVHAHRATTDTLTIGQTTYRIYEPAGSFGTIGQHFGPVERFVSSLSAPGNPLFRAVEGATGSYSITIPDGHVARLDTVIGALEPGEPEPPKPCKPGCSRCPTLTTSVAGEGIPASAILMVGMFGASGLALRIRRRKADKAAPRSDANEDRT